MPLLGGAESHLLLPATPRGWVIWDPGHWVGKAI